MKVIRKAKIYLDNSDNLSTIVRDTADTTIYGIRQSYFTKKKDAIDYSLDEASVRGFQVKVTIEIVKEKKHKKEMI